MMIYLDLQQSRREHPNENWARELMELFTVGIGNYTEQRRARVGPCFYRLSARSRDSAFQLCP